MKKRPKFHAYGWLPDLPDSRDFLYTGIKPRKLRLPSIVDLRPYCSAVEQQGALGSCTAQALTGNIEFLDNKIDNEYTDQSRLFIYYNERVIEHSTDYDAGAMLRDGIKTLHKDGVCTELEWPYDIRQYTKKPPASCYTEAKKHCIQSYHRITTLQDMLTCLAEGYPFVFGFTVYESFESDEVKKTGIVPMPGSDERAIGGHAVCAVGFNQSLKRFIVRNSWGTDWGMKGYFSMPFEYLETMADDFWTIRR